VSVTPLPALWSAWGCLPSLSAATCGIETGQREARSSSFGSLSNVAHASRCREAHPQLAFPSEDPVADTARFGSLLEAQIRDHPEQYLWIHRRFKGLSADYPNYYGHDSYQRKRRADSA